MYHVSLRVKNRNNGETTVLRFRLYNLVSCNGRIRALTEKWVLTRRQAVDPRASQYRSAGKRHCFSLLRRNLKPLQRTYKRRSAWNPLPRLFYRYSLPALSRLLSSRLSSFAKHFRAFPCYFYPFLSSQPRYLTSLIVLLPSLTVFHFPR